MSDTPRTDEQINGKPCTRFEVLAGDSLRNASVPSEFARELERELNIELERANYYREMVLQSSRRHAQSEGGEMNEPISGEKAAFPWPKDQSQHLFSLGMTLRDYFAAAALQGNLIEPTVSNDQVAKYAYSLADAMLKAREAK